MLGYNKNYATLVFNCVLKNSKGTISVSGMYRRDKKEIDEEYLLINVLSC